MSFQDTQNTILLVDDDKVDRLFARDALTHENYRVFEAMNGRRVQEILDEYDIDLVLLDLRLPGESGLALIDIVRHYTEAPIIILSGVQDINDKQESFNKGADDYITKPFYPEDLCARIRANLRRYKDLNHEHLSQDIYIGSWILDRRHYRLHDKDGKDAGLTLHEFRLLEKMVLDPNRIIRRDVLCNDPESRAIDVQITRIRKKLGDETASLIQTVRGIGYRLNSTPACLSKERQ